MTVSSQAARRSPQANNALAACSAPHGAVAAWTRMYLAGKSAGGLRGPLKLEVARIGDSERV
jgi:hypothetical protein